MTIAVADIGMFLTGGTSNTDPNLSLGGNVSSTEVVSNNLHAVFRRITDTEASSGVTLYRCLAIKNKSATDTMKNIVFYMVKDTDSPDDLALYSNAQAGKNTTETPIPNETTAPTGSSILFKATLNRSGGISLPDLAPTEYVCIWLRISVNPGAVQFPDNRFTVRCEVSGNPGGGGSGGGGSTPPPDPDTGVNFAIAILGDTGTGSSFTGQLDKIKKRAGSKYPLFIVFNGDLSYSSSMSGWLSATSSVRSNSIITFGNHDVDDGDGGKTTINDLKNAYGISKTYFSKIFKSVGIVGMEGGENESVSSASGGTQWTAVKGFLSDLKNNSGIEWIIVCNHYPIYGPSSHHPNEGGVRDDYDPLFDTYGVDIVVTSHNHNLWSSKLLKYNSGSPSSPTATGTDPNYSYSRATANHGKLYFGSGGGGKGGGNYGINSLASYTPFGKDSTLGYLYIEFSNNAKTATAKFYDSSDKLLKTVTLTHT